MLDGIEMHIIHMPPQVQIISNQVFPKPSLPNTPLALRLHTRRPPFAVRQRRGQLGLDTLPPPGEIRVVYWQRPDGVQMFGQYHHRVYLEGMSVHLFSNNLLQQVDLVYQCSSLSIRQVHRKEIRCARYFRAPIICHRSLTLASSRFDLFDGFHPSYMGSPRKRGEGTTLLPRWWRGTVGGAGLISCSINSEPISCQ